MNSPNEAYVDELYYEYLRDPQSVPAEWQEYFRSQSQTSSQTIYQPVQTIPNGNGYSNGTNGSNGAQAQVAQPKSANNDFWGDKGIDPPPTPDKKPEPQPAPQRTSINLGANDVLEPMNSLSERIAANMESSLRVPTATSVRTIPVKALEENRRIINKFLARQRKNKVSFTHIFAWAIVKTLQKYPQLNDTYTVVDGKAHRVRRSSINIGLAVDTTRKDGTRSLMVPSIKDSQNLTFNQFIEKYDDLIQKARTNKLGLDELMGTTISLTNPGTIGTIASIPRLMEGQGLIIATGSIDYPAEFQAVMPEAISELAVSKVVTVTSTYDHRIIQGAESGEFLSHLHKLLIGEEKFYEQIFAVLHIPFEPMKWQTDQRLNPFGPQTERDSLEKETKVIQMINAYRVRGHLLSDVNPLGLTAYYYPELDPAFYGFTVWDLDREFDTGGLGGTNRATLRDIIEMLRDAYCGTTSFEFMHIQAPEKKSWILNKIERELNRKYSKEDKTHIYRKLLEAQSFEQYLGKKFVGQKRFSLEGSESTIPFMDKLLEDAAERGLNSVVIGMAHRGRLNVLANIIGKPYAKIFNEFEGGTDPDSFQGSGDVKYHLGARGRFVSRSNKETTVLLAPNPSHLEAVNPVVEGMARAIDDEIGDRTYTQSLPVLLHGDAAFAGQGIVMETLNMSRLNGYKTGGTVHLIINNQIGFTTLPADSRSTTYASDIAKFLQVPILHVNGDDPEAVRHAAEFAFEYRETFNDDVIVDMYSYRKYGHNEADEPTFTQPLLYKKIKAHPGVEAIYRQRLIEEKTLSQQEVDDLNQQIQQRLNDAFASRSELKQPGANLPPRSSADVLAEVNTATDDSVLRKITAAITNVPQDFHAHPKLTDLLSRRAEMINAQNPAIDYAMAEALAIGSLLLSGNSVRLTGQDVRRGTFSHRHAVLTDIENERDLTLLNRIEDGQETFKIFDSPLSEEGVLGFEYGYSTIAKNALTLWEAQFGDFMNGAQIQIDQFVSCGEPKWGQTSNLVMLLPHGYEGQGPEHSSARLERFLTLCAEDNMFVCNFTSSANYFHALRRQVVAPYRKPLIVMTPKSLLRDPKAASTLEELTQGSFREIIDDAGITNPENVRRVLICSGKVYFDLVAKRAEMGAEDVAIVRLEQIYPFHAEKMRAVLDRYTRATEVVWVQEEPRNMGAWHFVSHRIASLLQINQRLNYIGRRESAAPATGSAKKHAVEQEALVRSAFMQIQ